MKYVKLPVSTILGKLLLFNEEIETVLCKVESILNSRPLIYLHFFFVRTNFIRTTRPKLVKK